MAWNLPDGKKPSFPGKDNKAQGAASWLNWLNCFEGGRFRPLRFAVMLSLLLLVAEAVQQQLAPPREGAASSESGGKSK